MLTTTAGDLDLKTPRLRAGSFFPALLERRRWVDQALFAVVMEGSQEMAASIIRTIFAQPDREHIQKQFAEVTTMLGRSHPKVAEMLADAEPDLLAFATFPRPRWRHIWSPTRWNG